MSALTDTILESLRAWPDLWRQPAVFALVHGADESPPSHSALLAALLEVEPTDLPGAWEVIVAREDMAAVQAFYELLAPRISADKLSDARRRFERRSAGIRARAVPLTGPQRAAVGRILDQAIATVVADPVQAERTLARADAQTREGEAQALAALERILAGDLNADGADRRGARLRLALEAGDLRLARILAGQLGVTESPSLATSPIETLPHDPWVDRQSTADLLRWYRDPSLAPAGRLPTAAFTDHDLALLDRLAEALKTGAEVSEADAEQMLRQAVRSLSGGGAHDTTFTALRNVGEDVWAFSIGGAQAARLFPHVADEHDVAMIVPRRPIQHLPVGPPERRFVTFDLFEHWAFLARPDSVLITPRMLVRALAVADGVEDCQGSRLRAFVRLQSAAIAVRPLILNVLGRGEARCRRLIDAPPEAALSAADIVGPLAQALDLYVDDGDLLALRHACGDRFPLLLEVLHILAEELESDAVSHRRFDALSALLRPEIENRVEAFVETDLRRRLTEEQRTDIALILGDAAALLENRGAGDGPTLAAPKLSEDLLTGRSVSSVEEGHARIAELLSLGLLRMTTEPDEAAGPPRILRTLPLPGRILLRMDD